MKVLFLSRWFPYPPNNGSKLRVFSLLQGLGQCHDVSLLSFADRSEGRLDLSQLRSFCSEIHTVPWRAYNPQNLRARLGFFSLKPRSVLDTFSPEMVRRIDQLLDKERFDVVVASQFDTAVYSAYFRRVPAVYEEVEVGVLYEQFSEATSLKRRLRYGLTWAKYRRYLASLLNSFQVCTVVSEQERQLLSQNVSANQAIEVIPNCIDLKRYERVSKDPQSETLIFTGSFTYSPNYEAMTWFLQEVYPHVQAQVPEVTLMITGDHADRPLPPSPGVELTGFVDDIRPLVASSWISLAPIWTGGGTRLKILEAMALRTPVVATSKGAEGLDVQHNEHLLIADTPAAFTAAIVRLLQDSHLRQRLAHNAYHLVREKYDWAAVMPRFLALVESIQS